MYAIDRVGQGRLWTLPAPEGGERLPDQLDALPRAVQADAGFDGRSYALSLASMRMLGALGLWRALADTAEPIREISRSPIRIPMETPTTSSTARRHRCPSDSPSEMTAAIGAKNGRE